MNKDEIRAFAKSQLDWARRELSLAAPGNESLFVNMIADAEAVLSGDLIHVRDDDWSWELAFPIVGIFDVDGWSFSVRGFDSRYMIPSVPPDWIEAHLEEYIRGKVTTTHEGRCLGCGTPVGAGYVELFTPGGRRFTKHYRDCCSCSDGGGPGSSAVTVSFRNTEALNLLISYVGQAEELQKAARRWLNKETGSVHSLKEAVRNLGI